MRFVVLLAGAFIISAPSIVLAADARNPYGNIDRRNDAGNDTGDSQVAGLNQSQLDTHGIPAGSYGYGAPGYAPPPSSMAYAAPAPAYDPYPAPSYYAPSPPAYDYRGYGY